jgi:hypothetical protein
MRRIKTYTLKGLGGGSLGSGTVTSVAMTIPTGLVVTGSPITTSGTLALTMASGYSIPQTASITNWDAAYNDMIVSAAVTGTTTKTLTLTQQDAGTITASWTDATGSGTVTSVAMTVPTGLTISGTPITTSGTLALTLTAGYSIPTTSSQTTWDTAYTNRITSLTVIGSSGAATLISNTLNIPNYTLAGLGGFANPMNTLGDVIYGNGSGTPTRLAGNTTAVKQYLSQTGTGTVSAAPIWSAITGADVTGAALTKTDDTNVTLTLGGTPTTSLLRATSITVGWTGTLADGRIASAATWNAKENALTFSAPLSRATNTISIPVATSLANGYLSSTDWSTFNGKQATITLTTTGSSGASTFVTNTLNIPNYTLSGLGGQPLATNLTSLAALTYVSTSFVKMTAAGTFALDTNTYYLSSNPSGYTNNTGTVTSVAALTLGTTGTDLSSTVATGTTTPVITLNVPTASAANRGALSSTDWSTFNGKQTTITLTTTGSSGAATFVTNTLNIPNYTLAGLGGLSNPMTTLGDTIYGIATGTPTRLAGNITTAKQFLSQTGNGTVSAAPIWATIAGSDITGAALTKVDDTNVTLTLGGTPTTALLRAASITVGWTGTLADTRIASATTWNAKESALTFSAPLTRVTNTISIPAATTSVNGYLTSTDWTTFNNKVSSNIYSADGTLAGARTVTQGTNLLTFTSSRTTGNSLTISSTQTAVNTADVGDGTLFVNYTLSATTGSIIQLVSRAFSFTATNDLANATSSITNLRVIDVQGKTNATTTTTNLDLIYVLGASTASGTVTTGRGIYIRNMQGASQGGLVIDTYAATNSTYLALGTSAGALPTGKWGVYQSDATFNNYFNGKVLLGTTAASTYELDVVGDIRGTTFTALAGTATATPLTLTLTSAVLNTTAVAGAYEVDTIGIPYYSYAASSRGVNLVSQFINLSSAYPLTSQIAAQKMFNTSTNGALTVQAATTYIFECDFSLSSMSSTAGTFGFAIGGTATITSIQWTSQAGRSATPTTPFSLETTFNSTAANTTLTSNSTIAVAASRIQGIIRINAAGTIIPQVSLTVAAAASVGANSRFTLYPIGTNTVTRSGNWS